MSPHSRFCVSSCVLEKLSARLQLLLTPPLNHAPGVINSAQSEKTAADPMLAEMEGARFRMFQHI